MNRVFVLASTRYVPGDDSVSITVNQAEPSDARSIEIHTVQSELTALAVSPNWGDEHVRAAAKAALEVSHEGDSIEVLTAVDWIPRWNAIVGRRKAKAEEAAQLAAQAVDAAAAAAAQL
jgi:hypothetical protein